MTILGWLLAWVFLVLYLWTVHDLQQLRKRTIKALTDAQDALDEVCRVRAETLRQLLGLERKDTIH